MIVLRRNMKEESTSMEIERWTHSSRKRKEKTKVVISGFSKWVGSEKSSARRYKGGCKAIRRDFYHYLPHGLVMTLAVQSAAFWRISSHGGSHFPSVTQRHFTMATVGLGRLLRVFVCRSLTRERDPTKCHGPLSTLKALTHNKWNVYIFGQYKPLALSEKEIFNK